MNTSRRALFGLLLGAPLGVAAMLAPHAVRADEPAHCTMRVIHALEQVEPPGGKPEPDANHDGAPDPKIDPKIDRLRPYLLRPPFTAWREFVLLDKRTIDLKMKEPQSFPLPNGKTATVTFVDHLPDQKGIARIACACACRSAIRQAPRPQHRLHRRRGLVRAPGRPALQARHAGSRYELRTDALIRYAPSCWHRRVELRVYRSLPLLLAALPHRRSGRRAAHHRRHAAQRDVRCAGALRRTRQRRRSPSPLG